MANTALVVLYLVVVVLWISAGANWEFARVGAILYTSYLQALAFLHEPTSRANKRTYPPPPPTDTFVAGFAAGTIQSVVAAPLDALQVRLRTRDILEGQYRSMWDYGRSKLREIGTRGIFAGWTLTFLRDALGNALFFSCFEYVKAQAYYSFVRWYYGSLRPDQKSKLSVGENPESRPAIRPHYALEPCFLMLAGLTASILQQTVQHPLGMIQSVHYGRLEYLDHQARQHPRRMMMRLYYHAYQETLKRCHKRAERAGGWVKWLSRGFLVHTIRQVPSTSAGLVIFELVRRKYANPADAVRIEKDGYDILLT